MYHYWYSQLCDVFIENSKSLLAPDVPADVQESAKQTLYTALDGALTMIHPIMPFVTEELWQRLPRRPADETFSIMRAAYPQYNPAFDDPSAEAAYELILATSKSIRSLLSEYEIKEQGNVKIQTYSETSHKTISDEVASIRSLSGKCIGDISILSPEATTPPAGCVVSAVSSEVAVYLEVSDEVRLDQQSKASESLTRAHDSIKKQLSIINGEGWKEKVKPAVQELEHKRLRDAKAEAARLDEYIRGLENLKISE